MDTPASRNDEALTAWLREHAPDCGDNSCVFGGRGKGGMRTNGGCRCFKDVRPDMRRIFIERMWAALSARSESAPSRDEVIEYVAGQTKVRYVDGKPRWCIFDTEIRALKSAGETAPKGNAEVLSATKPPEYRWIDEAADTLRKARKLFKVYANPRDDEERHAAAVADSIEKLLMGVPCPQVDLGFDSPADRAARSSTAPIHNAYVLREAAQQAIEQAFADVRRDGVAYNENTLQQLHAALCRRTDNLPTLDYAPPSAIAPLKWLEDNSTLHQRVEILYVVDGYEVQVMHEDGVTELSPRFHGATLAEAISAATDRRAEKP